jgi:hypothetical protein
MHRTEQPPAATLEQIPHSIRLAVNVSPNFKLEGTLMRPCHPLAIRFLSCFPIVALLAGSFPAIAQNPAHVRHSRFPNAASNDPQLLAPQDQAQACFTPESSRKGYEQFEQFDSYPMPASKGYLCINIPAGGTFVIDHLFAEADYDDAPPPGPEWYLNSTVGAYELLTGFPTQRAGSETANPHYLISQPMHLAVAGGTRVTLFTHSYYLGQNNAISETPGSASLTLLGHWE